VQVRCDAKQDLSHCCSCGRSGPSEKQESLPGLPKPSALGYQSAALQMKIISKRRKQARWAYTGSVLKSKGKFRSAPGGNPSGCRLHALTGSLFLGFLFIAPVVAQEPSGKPEVPTPKTGQVAIPLPTKPAAPPPAKSASEVATLKNLQALATEFLKYAAVVSCPKKDCTILVTNFVLPDGNTSPYGMQLADELSKELAGQNNKIQVLDRGLLQDLLTKDRVPAKSINEGVARSIAVALNATFVVLGTTKKNR